MPTITLSDISLKDVELNGRIQPFGNRDGRKPGKAQTTGSPRVHEA